MTNAAQRDGYGDVHIQNVYGTPVISRQVCRYPVKIICTPSTPDNKCISIFMLSYGGGLVSGDKVNMNFIFGEGVKGSLLTQGSTKVFKQLHPSHITQTQITVEVQDHALCTFIPDPVQPFAGSYYRQLQTFKLSLEASIVVLDWTTSGRAAFERDWSLQYYRSRNDFYKDSQLLTRDTMQIEGHGVNEKMKGCGCFATLFLYGPKVGFLQSSIREKFSFQQKVRRGVVPPDLLWTAGDHSGMLIVRVSAPTTEQVRDFLYTLLQPLESLIGDRAFRALK